MVALSRDHFRSGRIELDVSAKPSPQKLSSIINFDGEEDDFYYLDPENRYFGMIAGQKVDAVETIYQLRKFRVRVKDHCPTLTANMGLGGHNVPFVFDSKGLRKLTETECLRLQGFNSLSFPPNLPSFSKYQQVGNSVHVEVARHLGGLVRKKLEQLDE